MVSSCLSDSSSNTENLLDNEISDLMCVFGLASLRFFAFSVPEVSEAEGDCFSVCCLTASGFAARAFVWDGLFLNNSA